LEIAHSIEELKTICTCGKKALINARMVNGEFVFEGAQVAIDGEASVEYRSVCPQCYFRLKAEAAAKK
ncbi:MAG: thymidine kinase, partial [Oscillospiraceae bacterium]|nr:thymidine kinase [Oscillospiraceae bacterium]